MATAQHPHPEPQARERQLAQALRELIDEPHDTLDVAATRAGLSVQTVEAALHGTRLPTWEAMERLVIAYGGDQERFRYMWDSAAAPRTRPARATTTASIQAGPPDPLLLETTQDFVAALVKVRIWAGEPSLRSLERKSDGALARSTVSDMLTGDRMPKYDLVMTFLRCCGIGAELGTWTYTWRRLRARELRARSGG